MTAYFLTEAGDAHWDLLGDPRIMSPEKRAAGQVLRASMTERDWAKQQICFVVREYDDPLTDIPVAVQEIKDIWTAEFEPGKNNRELILNEGDALFREMADDGFIEEADAVYRRNGLTEPEIARCHLRMELFAAETIQRRLYARRIYRTLQKPSFMRARRHILLFLSTWKTCLQNRWASTRTPR